MLIAALWAGAAGAERVYRIQPGDTLWSLARASHVSVSQLLALNPGQPSRLRVGEVVRLPGGADVDRVVQRQPAVFQSGQAVYYPGRRDPRTAMTAAHLTLPKGTWVRVTHRDTGRSVVVLINDRGPFGVPDRIIDLSQEAAAVLGILRQGIAPVTLSVLSRR